MHKDNKLRRAARMEMQQRELRLEKRVNTDALKKFKEKPYQQKYEEMLKGVANMSGKEGEK